MSLYSNINAYEQISSFYPRWYLDFYEMREIIRIEALVAENAQKAIDLILDNHFLDTINEDKASELEEYLNISDISSRSIEERRKIIKSYFLGRGKLSLSQIIAIVQALSGGDVNGDFSLGDSIANHYIKLRITNCDIKYMLVDIISTLKERVPAHLWVELFYTPRKIEKLLTYNSGERNALQSVIGSPGTRKESADAGSYTACVQRNTLCSTQDFSIDMLYGGNFKSNYEDSVCGGDFASNPDATINGNY